jgi:hypothetical protein
LKICSNMVWIFLWKRNKFEKTPFHVSLLGNGLNIFQFGTIVTKKQGEHFLQCAHPHCWTSMDWSMILILLLKHDNVDSNILLLQDPNRHLSFMALIIWTTKDQTFILISFLGINRLFYVAGNSYPTTKSPQNINSTISTWFSRKDWTEFQGKVSQSKHHYFLASP